jgi:hypothetical protein
MAPRLASQAMGLPSKSTTTWDAYRVPDRSDNFTLLATARATSFWHANPQVLTIPRVPTSSALQREEDHGYQSNPTARSASCAKSLGTGRAADHRRGRRRRHHPRRGLALCIRSPTGHGGAALFVKDPNGMSSTWPPTVAAQRPAQRTEAEPPAAPSARKERNAVLAFHSIH